MGAKFKRGRRQVLQALGAVGVTAAIWNRTAAAQAARCETDGTPLQFVPKTAPDPKPLENELTKYPKCPYCGMDRREFHHRRHLIHYSDDLVDGTCSLHCAAVSLAINLDRVPKAIYAPDFAAQAEPKPLVNVDQATYLIGSDIKGVMTTVSKVAFAERAAAEAAQKRHGGQLGSFDDALRAAYNSLAEDTVMIRKRREERRRKAAEQKSGH